MSQATLRAFVEAVCPGLDADATAGAADVAAQRYVEHYLGERADGLSSLLDRAADGFANASIEARHKAIAALRRDPASRPLVDAGIALTLAAVYGSWSGHDEHGTLAREPLGWALTGYDGPARSRLDRMGG